MLKLEDGKNYNWKNQPEKLIYLGIGVGISLGWHQFALVDNAKEIWCEALDEDLKMLEETK